MSPTSFSYFFITLTLLFLTFFNPVHGTVTDLKVATMSNAITGFTVTLTWKTGGSVNILSANYRETGTTPWLCAFKDQPYSLVATPDSLNPSMSLVTIDCVLRQGKTYDFNIQENSDAVSNTVSGISTLQSVGTVCGPPGAVVVSDITRSSVVLTWTRPADDGGSAVYKYKVTVGDTPDSDFWSSSGMSAEYPADTVTQQITGLKQNTKYSFQVCADNMDFQGQYGNPGPKSPIFTTLDIVDSPPKPTLSSKTSESISISWTRVSGATEYRVEMRPVTATAWNAPPIDMGNVLTYKAEGLSAAAGFYFRVYAGSAAGYSEPSDISDILVTNVAAGTTLPTIAGLTVYELTPTSFKLRWNPITKPASPISNYFISLTTGAGDPPKKVDGEGAYRVGSSPDFTVSSLTPNTQYSFTVTAQWMAMTSVSDVGSWSTKVSITTPTIATATTASWTASYPAFNRDVTVTFPTVMADYLTISWLPPPSGGAGISNFRISYTVRGQAYPTCKPLLTDTQPAGCVIVPQIYEKDLSGLVPSTSYTFRMEAYTSSGWGTASEDSPVVTTISAKPSRPGLPIASRITDRSVTLSWTIPSSVGNAVTIDGYRYATRIGTEDYDFGVETGSSSLSITVNNLIPSTSYYFKVAARNTAYKGSDQAAYGDYSDEVNVETVAGAPGPPTNVAALELSTTGVLLAWTPPVENGGSSVTSYVVFQGEVDGTTTTYGVGIDYGLNVMQWFPLKASKNYKFKIQSKNSLGSSIDSAETGVVTLPATGGAPSTAPGKPVATALSSTTIKITWVPASTVNTAVTKYLVQLFTKGEAVGLPVAVPLGQYQYVYKDLVRATTYSFKVAAFNTAAGPYSAASDSVTTLCELPDPPGIPTPCRLGVRDVMLSWSVPVSDGGCPISNYKLYTRSGDKWDAGVEYGNAPGINLRELIPGTAYNFKVIASNSLGYGISDVTTSVITTFTGLPSIPRSVVVSEIAHTSLRLSWSAPIDNGGKDLIGYKVFQKLNGGTATAITKDVPGVSDLLTMIISDLLPQNTYSFIVYASNDNSVWISTAPETTIVATLAAADRPSAPAAAPVVGTITDTTIALSWKSPLVGPVTGYQLEMSTDQTTWTSASAAAISTRSYTVTSLSRRTAYSFRVTALNFIGIAQTTVSGVVGTLYSPFSAYATTLAVIASAPDKPVVSNVLSTSMTISWKATTDSGGEEPSVLKVETNKNGEGWVLFSDSLPSQLSCVVTGLTPGSSYSFRVSTKNSAGWSATSAPSAEEYTLSVEVPSIPGTPQLSDIRSTRATVTWTAPSYTGGIPLLGYQLFWDNPLATDDANCNNYDAAATEPKCRPSFLLEELKCRCPAKYFCWQTSCLQEWEKQPYMYYVETSTATSYVVDSLSPGKWYYFKVRAINAAGYSLMSAVSLKTSTPSAVGAPDPPVAISVTVVSATVIKVSWTPPVVSRALLVSYMVQWKTAGVSFQSDEIPASSLQYSVTCLKRVTTYTFSVRVKNSVEWSLYSTESASVTTFAEFPGQPGVPTAPAATISARSLVLAWTAPNDSGGPNEPIQGYDISYRTGSAPFVVAMRSYGPALSATVTGLSPLTSYNFIVTPLNTQGNGVASGPSAAIQTIAGALPALTVAPIAALATSTSVTLYWTASVDRPTYVVSMRTNDLEFVTLSSTTTDPFLVISGLSANTRYYFKVRSQVTVDGSSYISDFSPVSNRITTLGDATSAPSMVRGFSGVSKTLTTVTLAWTMPERSSTPLTGFVISKCLSSTCTDIATTISASVTTFEVTGLSQASLYSFLIVAKNSAGSSASAKTEASTLSGTIGAVTGITLVFVDQASIQISWTAATGAFDSYKLSYIGVFPGAVRSNPVTVGNSVTKYTINGLASLTSYIVRLIVVSGDQLGSPVDSNQFKTLNAIAPSQPGRPSIISLTTNSCSIIWTPPVSDGGSAVTNYQVQMKIGSGVFVNVLPGDGLTDIVLSQDVGGLSSGATIVARVAAINAVGVGSWSSSSALQTILSSAVVPGAPTNIQLVTASWNSMTVRWQAPNIEGASVSYYKVRFREFNTAEGAYVTVSASPLTYTATGLRRLIKYVFNIKAGNSLGDGPASPDSSAFSTTAEKPSEPGTPTLSLPTESNLRTNSNSLRVTWTAPKENGGQLIRNYRFKYRVPGGVYNTGVIIPQTLPAQSVDATTGVVTLQHVIDGLIPNTQYVVTIAAGNSGGYSLESNESNQLGTVLGVPDQVSKPDVGGMTQNSATVSWPAVVDFGGSAITNYYIFTRKNEEPFSSESIDARTNLSIVVKNLVSSNRYYFTVQAKNAQGLGAMSVCSNQAAPLTSSFPPSAPRSVISTSVSDTTVTLSYLPPSIGPVTSYSAFSSTDGVDFTAIPNLTSSTLSITLTGLISNTKYVFKLLATNDVGVGALSHPTAQIVTLPSATGKPTPTNRGLRHDQIRLTWTPSLTGGGDPVMNYVVTTKLKADSSFIDSNNIAVTINKGSLFAYRFTGLSEGTQYDFRVAGKNEGGIGAFTSSDSLTTTSNANDPPIDPRSPTITELTMNSLKVSWLAPSDAGSSVVTGYKVAQAVGNGAMSDIAGAIDILPTTLFFRVTRLTPNTRYSYQVAAKNSDNGYGAYSDPSSVTTLGVDTANPDAPGVATASSITDTTIVLQWPSPSTISLPLSSYALEYKLPSDANFQGVSGGGAINGLLNTFTVSGLTRVTSYIFRIRATNTGSKVSEYSVSKVIQTLSALPDPPTNLNGTPASTTVTVSFTLPSDTGGSAILAYRPRYRVSGQTTAFVDGADIVGNSPQIVVTGLQPITTYDITINSKNARGYSVDSAVLSGIKTIVGAPLAPGQPVAVLVTPSKLRVMWTLPKSDGGSKITNYVVFPKLNDLEFPSTGTTTTTDAIFWDMSNLSSNARYYFKIKAKNENGLSEFSLESIRVIVPTTASVPSTVIALVASNPSKTTIQLDWTPPTIAGSELTGWKIQYSLGTAAFANVPDASLSTLKSTDYTVVIPNLEASSMYTFRIAAVNSLGIAVWSVSSNAVRTLPDSPSSPLNLSISNISGTSFTVSWSAPTSDGGLALSKFKIEYRVSTSSVWAASEVAAEASEYTVRNLSPSTDYTVRVFAKNPAGYGSPSNEKAVRTVAGKPAPPGQPFVRLGMGTSVLLSWPSSQTSTPPVVSYVVSWLEGTSSSLSGGITFAAQSGSTTQTNSVTDLKPGVSYVFVVAARNSQVLGDVGSQSTPYTTPSSKVVPTVVLDLASDSSKLTSRQIRVTFGYPVTAGDTITNYIASIKREGESTATQFDAGAFLFYTFTSVTRNTQYCIQVKAMNSIGAGPFSDPVCVKTPGDVASKAGVPKVVAVQSKTISLTWAHPEENGGSPITGYTLYTMIGTTLRWDSGVIYANSTQLTVVGLSRKSSYKFKVAGNTASGVGVVSDDSEWVTTLGDIPSTPAKVMIGTITNCTVALSWSPPSDAGDSPITQYSVYTRIIVNSATYVSNVVAPSTLSAVVTGLSPGFDYTFSVAAKNDAGYSSLSVSSDIVSTLRIPPGPPGMPLVVNLPTQSSVDLSWTPPLTTGGSPIIGYKLMYRERRSPYSLLTIDIGMKTSFTLSGLLSASQYFVTAAALNDIGWSSSSVETGPIVTQFGVPASPTQLTASKITMTSLSLSWVAPMSDGGYAVQNYTIYRQSIGVSASVVASIKTLTYVDMFPSSLKGTTVNYFVIVQTLKFKSPPSAPVSVNFPLEATIPGKTPAPPFCSLVTDTSCKLSWTEPALIGAPITGYMIYSRVDSGGFTLLKTTSNANTVVALSGLSRYSTYFFKVRAINSIGQGPYSEPSLPIVTGNVLPDAPGKPEFRFVTSTSALIRWTVPSKGAPFLKYRLYTRQDLNGVYDAGHELSIVTVAGDGPRFEVRGLNRATSYFFKVVAINIFGMGPVSPDSDAVLTLANLASSPLNVRAVGLASDMVSLIWNAPVDNGGTAISSYLVNYRIQSTPSVSFKSLVVDDVEYFSTGKVDPSHTIYNLLPSTTYELHVAATTTFGVGYNSTIIVIWTPMANINTAEVSGRARFVDATTSSIRIVFDIPAVVNSLPYQLKIWAKRGDSGAFVDGFHPAQSVTTVCPSIASIDYRPFQVLLQDSLYATYANFDNPTRAKFILGMSTAIIGRLKSLTSASILSDSNLPLESLYPFPVSVTPVGASTMVRLALRGILRSAGSKSAVDLFLAMNDAIESSKFGQISVLNVNYQFAIASLRKISSFDSLGFTACRLVTQFVFTESAATGTVPLTPYSPVTFKFQAVTAYGSGVLGLESDRFLSLASIPASPVLVTSASSYTKTSLYVRWTAPTDMGGAFIIAYRLMLRDVATGSITTCDVGVSTDRTFTDLVSGSVYSISVKALNPAGWSLESAPLTVTILSDVPTSPGIPVASKFTFVLHATDATKSTAGFTVTWNPPSHNGGQKLIEYKVYWRMGDGSSFSETNTIKSTSRSLVMKSLVSGQRYWIQVVARNSLGFSQPSPESAQINTLLTSQVPAIMNSPVYSSATTTSLTIQWLAPDENGGSPITGYKVEYKLGVTGRYENTLTFSNSVFATTVTGLVQFSTYFFRVSALNAIGYGSSSLDSAAMQTNQPCPNDCNTVGSCNGLTGICTCKYGFSSSDCSVVDAPVVQYANFTNDGFMVNVKFDRPTNMAGMSGVAPDCSLIFDSASAKLLYLSKCMWLDGYRLRIMFGDGASLLPNTSLTFKSQAITSSKNPVSMSKPFVFLSVNSTILVEKPSNPVVPSVQIVAPMDIAYCSSQSITLSTGQAIGNGGRAWKLIQWSILRNVVSSSSLTFKPVKGGNVVTLSVTNFMDSIGLTTINITSKDATVFYPNILVNGGTSQVVSRGATLVLKGGVLTNQCGSSGAPHQFAYIWSIKSPCCDPANALVLPSTSLTGLFLTIPSNTMITGQSYVFTLTIVQTDLLKQTPLAQYSLTLQVAATPLNARFASGNIRTSNTQGAVLNVYLVDPDNSNSQVTYTWSFDGPPCSFVNDGKWALLTATNQLVIPPNALDLGTYTVSVVVSKDSRSATAIATVEVLAAAQASLSITMIPAVSKVQRNRALRLVVNGDGLNSVVWSVVKGRLDVAAPGVLRSGINNAAFVVEANQLLDTFYSFRVSARDRSDRTGTADIDIEVDDAPYGGICVPQSNAVTGVEYQTAITLQCTGWSGASIPLMYQFSYMVGSRMFLLQSYSLNQSLTTTAIPAATIANSGLITLRVDITNIIGSVTTIFVRVTRSAQLADPLDAISNTLLVAYAAKDVDGNYENLLSTIVSLLESLNGVTVTSENRFKIDSLRLDLMAKGAIALQRSNLDPSAQLLYSNSFSASAVSSTNAALESISSAMSNLNTILDKTLTSSDVPSLIRHGEAETALLTLHSTLRSSVVKSPPKSQNPAPRADVLKSVSSCVDKLFSAIVTGVAVDENPYVFGQGKDVSLMTGIFSANGLARNMTMASSNSKKTFIQFPRSIASSVPSNGQFQIKFLTVAFNMYDSYLKASVFSNIASLRLESPVTGAPVPLVNITSLDPFIIVVPLFNGTAAQLSYKAHKNNGTVGCAWWSGTRWDSTGCVFDSFIPSTGVPVNARCRCIHLTDFAFVDSFAEIPVPPVPTAIPPAQTNALKSVSMGWIIVVILVVLLVLVAVVVVIVQSQRHKGYSNIASGPVTYDAEIGDGDGYNAATSNTYVLKRPVGVGLRKVDPIDGLTDKVA